MKATILLLAVLVLVLSSSVCSQVAVGPTLLYSDPTDGARTANRSQAVTLAFSQAVEIKTSTVIITGPTGMVASSMAYGVDSSILVVTPTQLLSDGTYTVDFSGVLSGQRIPVQGVSTTTFIVDATPPTVVSSSPASGQTGVPVDTQISVTFSEPISTIEAPEPVTLSGPAGPVTLEFISHNANTYTFTYSPAAPLQMSTTYTVNYSTATDYAGNVPVPPASFAFTTAAPPAFTLLSSSPANGQTGVSTGEHIELTFSNDLDPQASSVTVTSPGAIVSGTLSISGPTATLIPSVPYIPGVTYTVTFSGVRDFYGQTPAGVTSISFTVIPPDPLELISAVPANGQAGVATNSPIVLTFNNDLAALGSSIVVSGAGLTTAGTLSVAGPTATFVPTGAYVPGVLYTVQFSGIRDVYSQSPTGLTQTTFSALSEVLNGRVDPPAVTIAAGEHTGVTYLLQNLSASDLRLRSSVAEFYVNDTLVGTANVPAEADVSANGTYALASDAAISNAIQEAARNAGADEILMLRTFAAPAPSTASVTIPLVIRIGGTLAGPASVTEIVMDVPTESKTVGQFEEIRAHAFVRGTGTGPVVGTWFTDGQPAETFQMNLTAGVTQDVWTRLSLPSLDLGEHVVELRIGRPHPVSSGERRYVVVPKGSGTQRVFIAAPTAETSLMPGTARASFKWVPMPGSSGYEIAFASELSALGLDDEGNVMDGPLGRLAWNDGMVTSGALSLLARVPSDVVVWTPTDEEYDELMATPPGLRYWAVRAVYPSGAGGDPTTTSEAYRVRLQAPPAALALLSPEEGAEVTAQPRFEWEAGPEGSIYELTILSEGRSVYTALTRENQFALSSLAAFKPKAGVYSWRVSALHAVNGVVAASARRTFVVGSESGSAASAPPSKSAAAGHTVAITPRGVYLLPGASTQLSITPPNGSVVATQQPLISATYAEASQGGVLMTLNGVDVTALASVTPTSASLQPPGLFSEGEHTVVITVNTPSGAQLQETSVFTVAVPAGTAAPATPGTPDTPQPREAKPIQFDLNWNWRPTSDGAQGGDFVVDLSVRGLQTWVWSGGSYAAFNFQVAKQDSERVDLAGFLVEGSLRNGKLKAAAGDIGMAESELTAQGLTCRSFNVVSRSGPVKVSATRTLGSSIQRSSIGRSPDMFLVTAENAGATPQKGVKLSYVDSESDLAGTSSFAGPTKSQVISLSGRTPLGTSGLNLKAELARSDATVVSAFGNQDSKGDAFTTTVDGVVAGFGVATSYRRVESEYVSPASSTLTNNIKGWVLAVNRPLGAFVNTSVNYSVYDNVPTSSTPASSLTSRSLDLSMNYPKMPALLFRIAKNDASSDPFTSGGRRGDTEENLWSATATYGGARFNGYLTYSKSDFDDYFDFLDPELDTPNDRSTGTWSFGFGIHPFKSLKLRADWGANDTDRWFRSLLGVDDLAMGCDKSRQSRIQAEYLVNRRVSATLSWTNSNYSDALGTYNSDYRNFNARLNYFLTLTKGGGGVCLTGEYRRYRYDGTTAGDNKNDFSILINDNRLLSL